MMYDTPHSENRTGYRPTWLLLCVDAEGRDYLWRVPDDTILVVDGAEVVKRRTLPADTSPEALVAQVAADIGLCKRHLAGSMADAIADSIEVSE